MKVIAKQEKEQGLKQVEHIRISLILSLIYKKQCCRQVRLKYLRQQLGGLRELLMGMFVLICSIGKELAESEIRVDCADRRSVKFEGKYLTLRLPFFSVVITFTVMYRWKKFVFWGWLMYF